MTDDDLDHSVLPKGKYGQSHGNPRTAEWVAENDPSYLVWAYETWQKGTVCSRMLYDECVRDCDAEVRNRRVSKDQS